MWFRKISKLLDTIQIFIEKTNFSKKKRKISWKCFKKRMPPKDLWIETINPTVLAIFTLKCCFCYGSSFVRIKRYHPNFYLRIYVSSYELVWSNFMLYIYASALHINITIMFCLFFLSFKESKVCVFSNWNVYFIGKILHLLKWGLFSKFEWKICVTIVNRAECNVMRCESKDFACINSLVPNSLF